MGIKQIITDDLTGEELPDGAEPTEVGLGGENYSVYLSDESKETFMAFLRGEAPLLQSAKTARPMKRAGSSGGKGKTETHGYKYAEVKAWAIANGIKAANGNPVTESTPRIGQSVYDAYKKAQE